MNWFVEGKLPSQTCEHFVIERERFRWKYIVSPTFNRRCWWSDTRRRRQNLLFAKLSWMLSWIHVVDIMKNFRCLLLTNVTNWFLTAKRIPPNFCINEMSNIGWMSWQRTAALLKCSNCKLVVNRMTNR